MEITDHVGNLHGRIGGLIYYTRNGRTFARRVAVPGRKRKPRTERQRATSSRFTMVQAMYHFYKENVSAESWRAAGKRRGMTAPNLFHTMNYGCLDGKGQLVTPELFHFAEGELLAAGGISVEAAKEGTGEGGEATGSGERWFRVRWEVGENWATAAASDLLRVGVIYEGSARPTPSWAEETRGRRGEGEGWFRLRTGTGRRAHVYVFFEREDRKAWSPSVYRQVEMPG